MESLYAIGEGIKRVCACTPVRYIITTAEKVKVHTFQIFFQALVSDTHAKCWFTPKIMQGLEDRAYLF